MTSPRSAAAADAPFFILGCVRSGTTMLRDILRLDPQLACPEETHFYRWAEPFLSPAFRHIMGANPTLKRHRAIDGVSEEEFERMLNQSHSRADLYRRYMARFIEVKKPGATRWFDKTPQNAYGAGMIAQEFPQAKFLHIVRDPVDVVASLRIGKVMKVEDMVAACAYWNEAAANLTTLTRAYQRRVLTIRYDQFTQNAMAGLEEVLAFLDLPFDKALFRSVQTQEVRHEASGVLSAEEMAMVRKLCRRGRLQYGFEQAPARHKASKALAP